MADENDFNMTPVVSSQLESVGFNPATSQGRVRFLAKGSRGSSLYEYEGCTQEEANSIINAPSAGTQFGITWKGIKPFRRLE